MDDSIPARHARALKQRLGSPGRMIAYEHTDYLWPGSDRAVIFNADVWVAGRLVWWGDLDLTVDEPRLVGLAADLGETVHVFWEGGARRLSEGGTPAEWSVFTVSASGIAWHLDWVYTRDARGRLVLRDTELAYDGFRFPLPPTSWSFWNWTVRRGRRTGARDSDGWHGELLWIGEVVPDGAPHLEIVFGRFRNQARGGWIELCWHPSRSQRPWAPPLVRTLRWTRGRARPWITVRLEPGDYLQLQIGISLGLYDPRWK